jgi:hypothetical protein
MTVSSFFGWKRSIRFFVFLNLTVYAFRIHSSQTPDRSLRFIFQCHRLKKIFSLTIFQFLKTNSKKPGNGLLFRNGDNWSLKNHQAKNPGTLGKCHKNTNRKISCIIQVAKQFYAHLHQPIFWGGMKQIINAQLISWWHHYAKLNQCKKWISYTALKS